MIPSRLCHVLSQRIIMNFAPGPLAKEHSLTCTWNLGAWVLRTSLQKDPHPVHYCRSMDVIPKSRSTVVRFCRSVAERDRSKNLGVCMVLWWAYGTPSPSKTDPVTLVSVSGLISTSVTFASAAIPRALFWLLRPDGRSLCSAQLWLHLLVWSTTQSSVRAASSAQTANETRGPSHRKMNKPFGTCLL